MIENPPPLEVLPVYQSYEFSQPLVQCKQIDNAQGTTPVYLPKVTGRCIRYDQMLASSSDTAAVKLQLHCIAASVDNTLGSVDIPAGSGYAGVAPVDILGTLLPAGQTFLLLDSEAQLSIAVEAAVTSGKRVDVSAFGGSF